MTIRKIIAAAIGVAALLVSTNASAVYNANMYGVVTAVLVYSDGDYIYFQLSTQPSSHPACLPSYFVIHSSVPADRRKAMLMRLMVAKETGETVNIGYDGTGDCADGYIRAHRVG